MIAEIGRIADPQLKTLALDAVRYIFLKYASVSAEEKMKLTPAQILQDLDKMGFTSVIHLKGNMFVFDMQKLVDLFTAKQSVEQSA